jgi:hypothetical protein
MVGLRGWRTKSETDVSCVTGFSGDRTLAQGAVL